MNMNSNNGNSSGSQTQASDNGGVHSPIPTPTASMKNCSADHFPIRLPLPHLTAQVSPEVPSSPLFPSAPHPPPPPHSRPHTLMIPPHVNVMHPAASLAYQMSNGFFPQSPFFRQFPPFAPDFRGHFYREDPKPNYSYIGLIAMAILSTKEKKMVLSDIYQWIQDNYPYFRSRGPGWRNSIRHNLSLNDCFIKTGRSSNGKGHYWGIHPANSEDFKKGDFRRRRAQRKVRKALGLTCPDEEDTPSPSPTEKKSFDWPPPHPHLMFPGSHGLGIPPRLLNEESMEEMSLDVGASDAPLHHRDSAPSSDLGALVNSADISDSQISPCNNKLMKSAASPIIFHDKKRKLGFDMASLLAPDHNVSATIYNKNKTEQLFPRDRDHPETTNMEDLKVKGTNGLLDCVPQFPLSHLFNGNTSCWPPPVFPMTGPHSASSLGPAAAAFSPEHLHKLLISLHNQQQQQQQRMVWSQSAV